MYCGLLYLRKQQLYMEKLWFKDKSLTIEIKDKKLDQDKSCSLKRLC